MIAVEEFYALLGCYAASTGNPLPTFRDNLSVPSSKVKKFENKIGKTVPSVFFWDITTRRCVVLQKNGPLIHIAAEA
jgi:hypothetical protein